MKHSPDASFRDPENRELWQDVELMAKHMELSRELEQRGIDPVIPDGAGEGNKSVPRARGSRLRRVGVGLALAMGCLVGSAGITFLSASLYRSILEMGASSDAADAMSQAS